jgi:hypothetical protein
MSFRTINESAYDTEAPSEEKKDAKYERPVNDPARPPVSFVSSHQVKLLIMNKVDLSRIHHENNQKKWISGSPDFES